MTAMSGSDWVTTNRLALSMVAGGVAIVLRRTVVVTTIAPIAVTATRMGTDPHRRLTQRLPFRPDHAVGTHAPNGPTKQVTVSR